MMMTVRSKKMKEKHRMQCILCISIALFMLILLQFNSGFLLSIQIFIFNKPMEKHVIVFDGGSTGTRMHVYMFLSYSNGVITLEDEYVEKTKEYLTKLVYKPQNVTISISELLDKARSYIPMGKWRKTPVLLKGTGGLRALSPRKRKVVLKKVRKAFKNSPFLYNNDSATILRGEEEGIYAWYTLNFLLGRLNDVRHSAICTDLGGQSFEITLSSYGMDTSATNTKNYYILPKLQQKPISLYTRSYAGFGGVSARLSLMHPPSGYLAVAENNGTKEILHPCFHPLDKYFWESNLKKRIMEVNNSELYSFENCYRKATEYLGNSIDSKSIDFRGREFYGLKGQMDHAYEIGAIDNTKNACTVDEFVNSCRSFCNSYEILSTFTCLDCSYISALWMHGLGIDRKVKIKFAEEIRGISTGWPLGVALSLLQ